MTKRKQSVKSPIFLIVAPIVGIILSIFLYAVINFIFSGFTNEPTTGSDISLSDGASVAQGAESSREAHGETPIFKTVANIILFLLGSVSMLAILPCLVIGIIMLNRRPQQVENPETKTLRDWGDLE